MTTEALIKPANKKEEILSFRREKIQEIEKFCKDKLAKSRAEEVQATAEFMLSNIREAFLTISRDHLSISKEDVRARFLGDEYLTALESLVAANARKGYWYYVALFSAIPVLGWFLMLGHSHRYHRTHEWMGGEPLFYDSGIATGWRYHRRRKWLLKNGFDPVEEIKKYLENTK